MWQSTVTLHPSVDGTATGTAAGRNTNKRCTWSVPQLLHRSALARAHPIGKVLSGPWGWGAVANAAAGDSDDEEETNSSSKVGGANGASANRPEEDDDVVNDLDDNSDEPQCRICQVNLYFLVQNVGKSV